MTVFVVVVVAVVVVSVRRKVVEVDKRRLGHDLKRRFPLDSLTNTIIP